MQWILYWWLIHRISLKLFLLFYKLRAHLGALVPYYEICTMILKVSLSCHEQFSFPICKESFSLQVAYYVMKWPIAHRLIYFKGSTDALKHV